MKLSTTLFPLLVITLHSATALPTWPSTIDELEDTMYLQTGYRAKNFASGVTPCGTSTFGTSRVTSAEWIRSAFHDMGNANVLSQTGGLDASLNFETSRLENDGQAFKSTLSYMAPYYSAQLPLADLLALAVYTAVRSCGGPIVPMRGGRRDAKVAGTSGFLPAPQNAISIFVAQFDRMGFNRTDMINLVACGHRLGGVHSSNFPEVVPVGSAPPDDFVRFVPSAQAFDEKIATEYLAGNSTNPLVVGPAITSSRASDSRVFGSDGNVTIRALAADRTTFRNTCSRVLQQMIEVVPSGVVLSDVLVPYEVKPVAVQLTLLDGGASVAFSGEIRVRVTSRAQSLIQSVVLVYKDRSGTCPAGSCTITTAVAGTAAGFDDSFVFYAFSTPLSTSTSISSFTVLITTTAGAVETYDNNGVGFSVQDSVIFQSPQSCLVGNVVTVVAAVRTTLTTAPALILNLKAVVGTAWIPTLLNSSQPMTLLATSPIGPYNIYGVSYTIDVAQRLTTHFDVAVNGTTRIVDAFKSTGSLGATCGILSGGIRTTTSSTSSSKSSSTSSSSLSTSSSSSSSTSSSSSSSTSSSTSSSSSSSTSSSSSSLTSSSSLATTSITSTTTTTSPTSSPTSLWKYLGCYADNVHGRALTYGAAVPAGSQGMTNEACQLTCLSLGYVFAGTEYSGECFCGNVVVNGGGPAADGETNCRMTCNGDTSTICGGPDRLSLYGYNGNVVSPSSSTQKPAVGSYTFLSCYTEATDARALTGAATASDTMTLESCAAACSGWKYWGAEFGRECYCGNSFSPGAVPATSDDCNMVCLGDNYEFCGAGNRLSVYALTT